ncbi:MAG: hypothetical protein Aurels2KO_24800 [Aureliella sp.]
MQYVTRVQFNGLHQARNSTLDAAELTRRIALLKPELAHVEVLRLSLLVAQRVESLDDLSDQSELANMCDDTCLKLGAATDQHEAVAGELDSLAATDSCDFSTDHLWTLVRAIKVQSQVLNLYLGASTERPTHLG